MNGLVIAQSSSASLQPTGFVIILGIVAVCAVAGFIAWAVAQRKLAAADAAFVSLSELPGVRPVRGHDLPVLAEELTEFFNQVNMSMYARHQNLLGAYRYEADGLTITIAHVVLGLERSNANHQTLDKVIVLVNGLPRRMPTFILTPNNYIMRKFHKQPVFPPTNAFGARNMVRGKDGDAIRAIFTDEAQAMFRESRNTVVQSHDGALAFYLHDETVIPSDMEAFLRDALAFAEIVREQAGHLDVRTPELAGSR